MSLTPMGLLGTDLVVSRLALGGNMLGGRLDADASFALLDHFVQEGGRLVDTAAVYADWLPGHERGCSEKTIGRWLRSRPGSELVVATKGGHPALDKPGRPRLDVASLRTDVEQSLLRLGLATLPLWFAHRDDPARPVSGIVAAVEAMRSEGLIRWYGMCNWSTRRLAEVVGLRDAGQAPGFVASASALSAVSARPGALASGLVAADDAMLALHRSATVTLFAYTAQAKGYFDRVPASTAYDDARAGEDEGRRTSTVTDVYDSTASRRVAGVVQKIARTHDVAPTQVALAAVLLIDAPVVPVVGCSSVARLDAALAGAALTLTDEEQRALLEVLPVGGSATRTEAF